jgi:hypothetical protein
MNFSPALTFPLSFPFSLFFFLENKPIETEISLTASADCNEGVNSRIVVAVHEQGVEILIQILVQHVEKNFNFELSRESNEKPPTASQLHLIVAICYRWYTFYRFI